MAGVLGSGEPFDPRGVVWSPVSPRLASLRRLSAGFICGLVAIAASVAAWWSGIWWIAVAAGLAALGFGWFWWISGRQTRAWGYAERDDDLLVRSGIMWRSIVVVPYGRLQYVDVHAGPIDRMFGVASVQLHTASAGTDARIPGLPPQEAAMLRDRLAVRGQARLAGL